MRSICFCCFILVWHGGLVGMHHRGGARWLQNQLVGAAARGDCVHVRRCVELGADVNMEGQGYEVCTPLVAAAHAGKVDAGRLLIELGARTDGSARPPGAWQWRASWCPLETAAKCGHAEFVRLLLREGRIPVRRRRRKLHGMLERAVRRREVDVAEVLFDALGRNLDCSRFCDVAQMVHAYGHKAPNLFGKVIRFGALPLARRLIEGGALVPEAAGKTLDIFSLLADDGASQVHVGSLFADLRRFAEAGGEVDLRSPCEHIASTCGYIALLDSRTGGEAASAVSAALAPRERLTLLQLIARVPEQFLNGQEATDQACAAAVLLQCGADRLAVDSGGRTPLHLAAMAGSLDLIHVLTSVPSYPKSLIDPRLQEAQLSLRTTCGYDDLQHAVRRNWRPEVTRHLCWLRTLYGMRVLYRAAKRRRRPLLPEIVAGDIAPFLVADDEQKKQMHQMLRAVDRAWRRLRSNA